MQIRAQLLPSFVPPERQGGRNAARPATGDVAERIDDGRQRGRPDATTAAGAGPERRAETDAQAARRVEAAVRGQRSAFERVLQSEQPLPRASQQALRTFLETATFGEEASAAELVGIDIRV